jgi:serine/threonine protein kinase, bacterial
MLDASVPPANLSLQDERYQVLQVLGDGGFGQTFLAEDTQMPSRRKCVIKQLKPISDNPEVYQIVQERFQREAAILEQLGEEHPQIPRLYAYIQEGTQFYLVEEWIEGPTLTQKVQNGVLDEASVRDILISLLPVLDYVHQHRMVHRDLKPDNIILRQSDQQPVLIDFGTVKETMHTVLNSQGQSARSIVVGTPGYMPSEQLAGRPVYSSDLYSLGLTAIYLLTGKVPQQFETDPETGKLLWQPHETNLSPDFVAIVEKSIHLQPSHRFATASQMLEALDSASAVQVSSSVNPDHNNPALMPTVLPTAPQKTVPISPSPESLLPTTLTPQTAAQAVAVQTGPTSAVGWKQAVCVGGLIGGSILAGAMLIRAELPGLLNASQSKSSPAATPVITSETQAPQATSSTNTPSAPPPPITQPVRAANPNAPTNAAIVGKPGTKNIRSGPGTTYGVQGSVGTGDRVQIVDNGYDNSGYPWYKIYVPASGTQGWMASHLVASDSGVRPSVAQRSRPSESQSAPPKESRPTQEASTNATIAGKAGSKNIRSGPGTSYDVQFETSTGNRAKIIGQQRDREGYLWYQIYVPSANAQGWIAAQLVSVD